VSPVVTVRRFGTLPDGIRHIDGPDTVGEKPEELKIGNVDVRQLEADGHKNLWVMADLNGGGMLGMYTLLMVFDDSASPKLLDAAEVDTDQLTGFLGAQLRISARDEAITVDSEHSNSSQIATIRARRSLGVVGAGARSSRRD